MNLKDLYDRYCVAQLNEKYKDAREEGKKTGDLPLRLTMTYGFQNPLMSGLVW